MVSMTKEEMIQYLHDYAQIAYFQNNATNLSIGKCFNIYMTFNGRKEDNTQEYYDTMRNVYIIYCIMKIFSFSEDYVLNRDNYIVDDDLDNLKEDLIKIEASNNISNKQIIRLIRNAFNHNNDPKFDRFKISKNAKNIEISFKDLRTPKEIATSKEIKPFSIKFNLDYLNKVLDNIINKSRTTPYYTIDLTKFNIFSKNLYKELDKIKITNYLFPKKLTKDQKEKINKLQTEDNTSEEENKRIEKELCDYITSIADPYEYKMTKIEKEKFCSLKKLYIKIMPELLKTHTTTMTDYFLNQSLSIPDFKKDTLYDQLILAGGFYGNPMLSKTDIINSINDLYSTERILPNNEIDSMILSYIFTESKRNQIFFMHNMISRDFLEVVPSIMYLDSVITHYCTDETITIDNITYETEKIRNSLVHGRWLISKDTELVMYDADPRNNKSNNLEYVGSIKMHKFIEWSETYVNSKKTKKENILSLKK